MHTASSRRQLKNNIAKYANFRNNVATEVEFHLFGGGEDGEHSGVCFVEISKLFLALAQFSLEQNHLAELSKFFQSILVYCIL